MLHNNARLAGGDPASDRNKAALCQRAAKKGHIEPYNRESSRNILHMGRRHLHLPASRHLYAPEQRPRDRHDLPLFHLAYRDRLLIHIVASRVITKKISGGIYPQLFKHNPAPPQCDPRGAFVNP